MTSPGNGTGNGSVSRFASTAGGAATSAASTPASASARPRQTDQAAGTPSGNGMVGPWNSMTAIAGGAATVAIAVAVFMLAAGRRKRSGLGGSGNTGSAS
ncbi:hypothetical protein [Arthrobacter methylotrophus]|uniref:Uncharacterized protein n=1 Tax=Arthrobacter methylotrophus TaxID=121291 RepID=A0ABV5UMT1_9MICC